ncbi:hypothetical protein BDR06DRAFT_1007338 [Suillus hirtellus]|nr:hypothetical protein BDR06DRAFT_1007338 [Suillus hirtellus]
MTLRGIDAMGVKAFNANQKRKAVDQDVDNEQLFSDDEVGSKPAKRVPKKRVVRDDEDQDAVGGTTQKAIQKQGNSIGHGR